MIGDDSKVSSERPQIDYVCSDADVEAAVRLLREQRRWEDRFTVLFLLVLIGFGLFWRGPQHLEAVLIGMVGLVVVLWNKLRPPPKQKENEHVSLSENGFTITSSTTEVRIPFETFAECLESQEVFMLFGRFKRFPVIVPKRVFPSKEYEVLFRAWVAVRKNQKAPGPSQNVVASERCQRDGCRIQISETLGFRDSLDLTMHSWRLWVIIFGIALFCAGQCVYYAIFPEPNAVMSASGLFFLRIVPFLVGAAIVFLVLGTLFRWRGFMKCPVTQVLVFTDKGIAFRSLNGEGSTDWALFTGHKETRRSFLLWRPGAWIMAPKRCFSSAEDLNLCRQLISSNVRRSIWFFG